MYQDLLTRYGVPSRDASHTLHIYVAAPETMTTPEEVVHRDKWAAQQIAELERYAADLKDYRRALAERYAALETMTYTDALKLERRPEYTGIRYYVTITRRYEDGTEQNTLREKFAGVDRYKAFARFEEIKKQRPGIQAEKDTARRAWER